MAPVLAGVPGDVTINVNNGDTFTPVNVTATDNCDTDVEVFYAAPTILPDPCSNTITYPETWSATDDCNNLDGMVMVSILPCCPDYVPW